MWLFLAKPLNIIPRRRGDRATHIDPSLIGHIRSVTRCIDPIIMSELVILLDIGVSRL
jgi:hypothetical protein